MCRRLSNHCTVLVPHSDPSSLLNGLHALAPSHALNMESKVSTCSSVHRRGCFLSLWIPQSGLTGLPPFTLSALSAHRAVLPPTAKARSEERRVGKEGRS